MRRVTEEVPQDILDLRLHLIHHAFVRIDKIVSLRRWPGIHFFPSLDTLSLLLEQDSELLDCFD
jgi:hypothetical protein